MTTFWHFDILAWFSTTFYIYGIAITADVDFVNAEFVVAAIPASADASVDAAFNWFTYKQNPN